jgi:hypothetical protein
MNTAKLLGVFKNQQSRSTFATEKPLVALLTFWFVIAANAVPVGFTYDSLNRLTKTDYGNGSVINYAYDPAGNRLTYSGVVANQYTYTTNNGTITITKYTGPGGAVTIPSTINGLPVTSIGDSAFESYTSLTSVTIGNNVISIEDWAFEGCTSLASVTIPDSVTSIGYAAFVFCTGLTSVTIGNSVTSIGEAAFSDCTSLTSITIPDRVTSIENETFYGCFSLTNATIGNSVTSIGDWAFYGCTGLSSVTIPNSVTNIGEGAFESCTSLTSVTIPNSVTSIARYAFYSCTSLTGVYFQGNAPNADSDVFNGADNATVYYLAGTTGWTNPWQGRPTVMLNPLVVGTDVYQRVGGLPCKIQVADLLTNDSGDSITFAGVNLVSTNGVNLATNATTLFYANVNAVDDQLTYSIRDLHGNVSPGLILIQIVPVTSSSTVVGWQPGVPGPNTNTLTFAGIPNYQYVVQFATNATDSPWFNLSTNFAGGNGLWTVLDPTATNANRCYRVRTP